MEPEHYLIGDSCICWSLGNEISLDVSSRVLGIYRALKAGNLMTELHILDLVPSYRELAVHFNPNLSDLKAIIDQVAQMIRQQLRGEPDSSVFSADSGKRFLIAVEYQGEDLDRVAETSGLNKADVIRLHTQGRYVVAMVGFLPHFPYLIGLDKRLETPRLDTPRISVPAGSVAIGGAQTGIYPRESPGGWNILGYTDPGLLNTIEPGDIVEFEQVGKSDQD